MKQHGSLFDNFGNILITEKDLSIYELAKQLSISQEILKEMLQKWIKDFEFSVIDNRIIAGTMHAYDNVSITDQEYNVALFS